MSACERPRCPEGAQVLLELGRLRCCCLGRSGQPAWAAWGHWAKCLGAHMCGLVHA